MCVIGYVSFEPIKIPDLCLGGRHNHEHILAEPSHGEIRLDTAVLIQPLGIDHSARCHINIVGTYRTQHAGSVATFQPEFSEG